jgi:hypothetical protein
VADLPLPDWGVVPSGEDGPADPFDREGPFKRVRPLSTDAGSLAVLAPERFHDSLRESLETIGFSPCFTERPRDGREAASEDDPFDVREYVRSAGNMDAVLLVVPTDRSLATVVPGPVVDGVPIGLVPADEPAELRRWLDCLQPGQRPVAVWGVLAMGTDQYLEPAADLYRCLRENEPRSAVSVHDWRASRIDRSTLCQTLARGPALGIYLGHGTGDRWGGYQGCAWEHVAGVSRERAIGTLVILACDTLATDDGLPFGVRFVRSGRARAVVGVPNDIAVTKVQDTANVLGQHRTLAESDTIGAVLSSVVPSVGQPRSPDLSMLRIVGLPVQPLCSLPRPR